MLRFLEPCDLEIWRTTLKNNRAPLPSVIKLYASFHHHMWIQNRVTVRKRLSWVLTSVTLTFDLWPWHFAWTSLLSLVMLRVLPYLLRRHGHNTNHGWVVVRFYFKPSGTALSYLLKATSITSSDQSATRSAKPDLINSLGPGATASCSEQHGRHNADSNNAQTEANKTSGGAKANKIKPEPSRIFRSNLNP